MPGPISNNAPVTVRPTTTSSADSGSAAAPAQSPAATPTPAAFTPVAASTASVQSAANPGTGFDAGPARAATAPAAAAPSAPVTLDGFKAMVPAQVDTSKYDALAKAFGTLSHHDKKAALQYVESQNQPGLAQYLKDTSGGGSFWSSLGNAIGESLFGGNR